LTSLSTSALTGEQLYAPYGTTRYTVGSLGTAKAFTGQEADPLTGLYYYHARWYDPVVGVFLSVDTQEGNAQGVNPYGYVRENPETATDPTGERVCIDNGATCKDPRPGGGTYCYKNGPNCSGGPSGPSYNDCAANPSLQGCSKYPCAAGPLSTNNCTYGSGDCKGLTFAGCKKQHAYKDAARAREHFQNLADLLAGKFALMGQLVIQFFLTILGLLAGPIISLITGIVGGIVAGLSALGLIAGDLAQVFRGETNKQDLRDGPGLSWFTKANIAADSSQIQDILANDTGMFTTGGGAFSAYTAITGLLVGGIVGFTKAVWSFVTGGASFGIAFAVTVGVGAAILGQQAQGYLNQEEADLA